MSVPTVIRVGVGVLLGLGLASLPFLHYAPRAHHHAPSAHVHPRHE